jgi:hypothetical protein
MEFEHDRVGICVRQDVFVYVMYCADVLFRNVKSLTCLPSFVPRPVLCALSPVVLKLSATGFKMFNRCRRQR